MVGKAYRLYKGPIYLKFTYTVVYIYTYKYTFTNNLDKATDPDLSLPNPVFSWWPEPTLQNNRIQSSSYMFKSPRSILSESEPKRPGFETLNKKENV